MISVEGLKAILKRAEKATPGDWRIGTPSFSCPKVHNPHGGGHDSKDCSYEHNGWWGENYSPYAISVDKQYPPHKMREPPGGMVVGHTDYEEAGVVTRVDADFIAHSRTDLPRVVKFALELIEERDALREEVKRLRRLGP